MQKSLFRKGLVLGIIVLFIGASVVPSTIGEIRFKDESKNYIDNIKSNNEQEIYQYTPPNEVWNKTFGGNEYDDGWSVQQTTDEGYIITGRTYSYGTGGSVWLIKTDINGTKQWSKTFGGSSIDMGWSVQQTTDEGYIITGNTRSYGAGSYDVWLIKTDSNGNEEWDKTFGGTSEDYGRSVKQCFDGGYIITGFTESYGAGYIDVIIIKTNETGIEQWIKTFGGTEVDYGFDVLQIPEGGYIITGSTESYGPGYSDVWLIKIDENGNEIWNKTFGGSYDDYGYSVKQTNDGGFIITGSKSTYGSNLIDVWLIKTNETGIEQWNKTYGGNSDDEAMSVQQTMDGGYIITGFTESYGAGSSDVWLIKTDANGTMEWNKAIGGTAADEGHFVCQTVDDCYILTGKTRSYGHGGSDFDVWLIKVSSEYINQPDLDCYGDLSWTGVTPGDTVSGSITVENIGDIDSLLDWQIDSYPDWGDWTFDPDGGDDLLAGTQVTVDVEIVAPDEPETEFTGEVKIVNSENPDDTCVIDVSLATPVSQQLEMHPLFQRIFERFPNTFPILRNLMGL